MHVCSTAFVLPNSTLQGSIIDDKQIHVVFCGRGECNGASKESQREEPSFPSAGCTYREGKNSTKEEEKWNLDSSLLQVFSSNRTDAFAKEWSKRKQNRGEGNSKPRNTGRALVCSRRRGPKNDSQVSEGCCCAYGLYRAWRYFVCRLKMPVFTPWSNMHG